MGETTANYSFKKRNLGHPVRDDDIGDNLDLIDVAIKARADAIASLKGVLSVGPILQVDALNLTVYFPFKVTITKVRSFLLVVLATADSVVTMKKHDGTSMTDGVLTITSTGSVGDEDSCSPSAENVIAAGEKMTLAIGGGASAGEALFFIEYMRTP